MQRVKVLETLLAIIIGLLVFYFIFSKDVLLYISLLLGLISLFWNSLARRIAWLWLKCANILGELNGKILLSLVFFIFLTPIAILNRLFSKNLLQLKRENKKSMFTERNITYQKKDLENIF